VITPEQTGPAVLERQTSTGAMVNGPIPLPRRIERYTVLRSQQIDRKVARAVRDPDAKRPDRHPAGQTGKTIEASTRGSDLRPSAFKSAWRKAPRNETSTSGPPRPWQARRTGRPRSAPRPPESGPRGQRVPASRAVGSRCHVRRPNAAASWERPPPLTHTKGCLDTGNFGHSPVGVLRGARICPECAQYSW